MTVEPTTQDKQITIDVPEDRVAEFYAFYGRFLAGFPGRRGRGRGAPPLRPAPPPGRVRGDAGRDPDGLMADKQITVAVPEERVPEFYVWFASFLAAEGGGGPPLVGGAPRRPARRPAPRLPRAAAVVRGRRRGRVAVRQARAARAGAVRRSSSTPRRAPRGQRDRRTAGPREGRARRRRHPRLAGRYARKLSRPRAADRHRGPRRRRHRLLHGARGGEDLRDRSEAVEALCARRIRPVIRGSRVLRPHA